MYSIYERRPGFHGEGRHDCLCVCVFLRGKKKRATVNELRAIAGHRPRSAVWSCQGGYCHCVKGRFAHGFLWGAYSRILPYSPPVEQWHFSDKLYIRPSGEMEAVVFVFFFFFLNGGPSECAVAVSLDNAVAI